MKLLLCLLLCLAFCMSHRSYYDVLGVERTATTKEIQKAYRKLSIQLHPDKNPGNHDAFVELAGAYEVLEDPEKRRIYDQFGEEGLRQHETQKAAGHANNGRFGGFNPFESFFGGFGRQEQTIPKGDDFFYVLDITLSDLYIGKEIQFVQTKQILCSHCRGTGADDPVADVAKCSECDGHGVKVVKRQIAPGFFTKAQVPCDRCQGKGTIVKKKCPHCNGNKLETATEEIRVIVERGMKDKERIVLNQQMDQNPDTLPGDLIFILNVLDLPSPNIPTFTRKNNDLSMKLELTLLEALTGFKKTFTHLDNHNFEIFRHRITTPGYIQTIEGEGMPHHQAPSIKGNLYITYSIKFPDDPLSLEQIEGFKKLLQ